VACPGAGRWSSWGAGAAAPLRRQGWRAQRSGARLRRLRCVAARTGHVKRGPCGASEGHMSGWTSRSKGVPAGQLAHDCGAGWAGGQGGQVGTRAVPQEARDPGFGAAPRKLPLPSPSLLLPKLAQPPSPLLMLLLAPTPANQSSLPVHSRQGAGPLAVRAMSSPPPPAPLPPPQATHPLQGFCSSAAADPPRSCLCRWRSGADHIWAADWWQVAGWPHALWCTHGCTG